jgi:signal transduction histidine kinase
LRSLVENAVEAIDENAGTIADRTGVIKVDSAYLANAYLGDDLTEMKYTFIEVADNGEGFNKEAMRHVFEPFFSTRFQGRGLGLAATLGIVRAHRGAFVVESKVGEGITIRALFPLRDVEQSDDTSPCA